MERKRFKEVEAKAALRRLIVKYPEYRVCYAGPIGDKEVEAVVADKWGQYLWSYIAKKRGLTGS